MAGPAFLLDTNILWRPALRNQLAEKVRASQIQVYIPTLIHAERIRQIADAKGENFALAVIQQLVKDAGFELLPFSVEDAEAVAEIWLELRARGLSAADWRTHNLDILLCAVARARGYTLITDDRGAHFAVIAARMSSDDLAIWLQQN